MRATTFATRCRRAGAGLALPLVFAQALAGSSATPAEAALSEWLAARSTRHELRLLSAPSSFDGAVAVRVRALPADTVLASRMTVWVEPREVGGAARAAPVTFAVRAWGPAWTATDDVAAGTDLARVAWVRGDVELTAAREAVVVHEMPPGGRLRVPLRAGEALRAHHVEAVPPVRQGERVTVRMQRSGLAIETYGESLQDGQLGRAVWVRTVGALGAVRGVVAAPALVEVQP